jgi:ketosteroid isomerase-like protein
VSTDAEQIQELECRWARAEMDADSATLDAITLSEFVLVGPLGFVLNKQQWMARYQGGGLQTHALEWDIASVRVLGDTAITIGEQVQRADYRSQPADGRFRATHILVRTEAGWQLAGMQLSPIRQPESGQ